MNNFIDMVQVQMDKVRNLKYSKRAFARAESILNTPVAKINLELLDSAVTMLWAGLVHEDKNLTIDDVWDMIDSYDEATIEKIFNAMAKAIKIAFPESKEKNQ